MKGLTKDEKQAALKAFIEPVDAGLEVLDRSTLEKWATCPWQAKACEEGRSKIVGLAAEAGEAIHQALGRATLEWVNNGDNYDTAWQARDSIKTDLEFELRRSRPDLQPEVLKGMLPSVWAWSDFLARINPGNVLGFDGGDEVGRSSQLAYDFPDFGARVTSEIDLLCANKNTVELIDWTDYKTGQASHDSDEVADAFQFQMHAMLILHHFPDVKAARLTVWDTRKNRRTYTVTFPRERLHDYEWRVRSALQSRKAHRDNPPTWPTIEKCRLCDVAAICPVASKEYPLNAAKPEDVLADLIAVEVRADALKAHLKAHVDATKQDVKVGTVCFGRNKPPSNRKPNATIYELSTKGDANEGSDGSTA